MSRCVPHRVTRDCEGVSGWGNLPTDAKRRHGLDAHALAEHASSAMTDHYIKRREIEKVMPLPALPGGEY